MAHAGAGSADPLSLHHHSLPNHSTLPNHVSLPKPETTPIAKREASSTNLTNHNHETTPPNQSESDERRENKRKSATLTPSSSAHNPANTVPLSSNNHMSTSNFRRSFTLPRSLTLRRPPSAPSNTPTQSQNDPNSGLNSLRNIFLSLLKGRKTGRRKKDDTTSLHNTQNGLPAGFLPAAVGLKNQGNTCFMNAILQCLSHTDLLAKYLVTDQYKTDLRKKYWIKNGKGEVTDELASILKSTWLRMNASVLEEAAAKFKAVVERFNPQWKGSEQHDAQEFLIWLLNRLHEDLNLAPSTKYKQMKNNFGRPDEQVAAEWLANHVRCNNSIIEEIFGAHFRSSLTCPGCGRTSATFDFFNMVSLPIPEPKQELPVYVNILYLSQQPRQVKLGLSMNSSADVKELKHLLSVDTDIEEKQIVLTEVDGEGFHRTFTESQPVSVLSRNEALYCVETPLEESGETEAGAFLLILWTNLAVTNEGATKIRFGSPYVTRIARETPYTDLQKLLLKEMAPILQPGVLIQEQKDEVFSMRVLDGSSEGCVLEAGLEHPLYMECVDQALSLSDNDIPPHIKIHLEWTQENKDKFVSDDSESVEEHSSVSETRAKYGGEEPLSVVTLGECFDLYTKVEQLSPEDSWHCPHCNRKEEGTLVTIGLWTAPQILVLHLKRFRQATKARHSVTKISVRVDFPTEGLDLAPHVSKRSKAGGVQDSMLSLNGGTSPMNGCFGLGSWKNRASFKKTLFNHATLQGDKRRRGLGAERPPTDKPGSMTYDLFAVCNHLGKDLQSGHYTAYCKNPVDKSWWSFDDTRVTELDSSAPLNTPHAYILFYQRTNPAPPPTPTPVVPPLAPLSTNNHWCGSLVKKHVLNHPPLSLPPSLPSQQTNGHEPSAQQQHMNGEQENKSLSPPSPDLTIESTV